MFCFKDRSIREQGLTGIPILLFSVRGLPGSHWTCKSLEAEHGDPLRALHGHEARYTLNTRIFCTG